QVVFGEREGTLLIASQLLPLEQLLDRWDRGEGSSLRQNRRFRTLMEKVHGTRDEEAQLTWFFDPIELAHAMARDGAARLALALLPTLGLDGLHGIGGSLALATDDFDSVWHVHVLLDQ